MKKLSTSAQAVLDATYREMDYAPRRHVQWAAAAAILAAVDQVLPEVDLHVSVATDLLPKDIGAAKWSARHEARQQFLAIAAELNGGTTTPDES